MKKTSTPKRLRLNKTVIKPLSKDKLEKINGGVALWTLVRCGNEPEPQAPNLTR